eukprot:Awhi_evm1s13765
MNSKHTRSLFGGQKRVVLLILFVFLIFTIFTSHEFSVNLETSSQRKLKRSRDLFLNQTLQNLERSQNLQEKQIQTQAQKHQQEQRKLEEEQAKLRKQLSVQLDIEDNLKEQVDLLISEQKKLKEQQKTDKKNEEHLKLVQQAQEMTQKHLQEQIQLQKNQQEAQKRLQSKLSSPTKNGLSSSETLSQSTKENLDASKENRPKVVLPIETINENLDFSKENRALDYISEKVTNQCSTTKHSSLPETLDLVIFWIPNHKQNYTQVPDRDLYFDDLKYSLRSYEKHGLLSLIRNVYLLINDENAEHYGPGPEYLEFNDRLGIDDVDFLDQEEQKRVKLVYSSRTIGHKNWCDGMTHLGQTRKTGGSPYIPESWCGLAKLHLIPGIAENFLVAADDVVLTTDLPKESLYSYLYDPSLNLPYIYSHGGLGNGKCLGNPNLAVLHGINLVNKCVNQATDGVLNQLYNYRKEKKKDTGMQNYIDPICVGKYAAKKAEMTGKRISYGKTLPGKPKPFFKECHTNGGCSTPNFNSIFINIQGNGISEEYSANPTLRDRFLTWFRTRFPAESKFERSPSITSKSQE